MEKLEYTSVLFEMYVDDIWMDNSYRSRAKRTVRGFDVENFDGTLIYTDILIKQENKLRSEAFNRGMLDRYFKVFGKETIVGHLVTGLRKSLRRSSNVFYRTNDYENSKIDNWNKTIQLYLTEIRKIENM